MISLEVLGWCFAAFLAVFWVVMLSYCVVDGIKHGDFR